jgi:hypothetical protein
MRLCEAARSSRMISVVAENLGVADESIILENWR